MIKSRKRPAPGSALDLQQQPRPTDQQTFTSDTSQMSDDQFLNWGQVNASNPPMYQNNNLSSAYPPNLPPNQVARRAQNLIPSRAPVLENDEETKWNDFAADQTGDDTLEWANDEVESERRAQIAKREQQGRRKQIPPFIQKLSSFLDDGKNTDLIRWSESGDSFIVLDEDEFAKTLIPELFKHNNYASFVRQLNMYGFHKKVGLSDNSMRNSERKNKSPSEYSNPFFKRGRPNLLWLITKPRAQTGRGRGRPQKGDDGDRASDDEDHDGLGVDYSNQANVGPGIKRLIGQGDKGGAPLKKHEMTAVQAQLNEIRRQQQYIYQAINKLSNEHNTLTAQAAAFQDRHNRQENSIQAILTFLATVYHRSLEGHDGLNLANMFTNALGRQNSGSVMEAGDFSESQPPSSSPRPFPKRQPLLLQAPRASTLSPASNANSPQTRRPPYPVPRNLSDNSNSRTIEEISDRQSVSPQVASSHDFDDVPSATANTYPNMSDRDIMRVINQTNNSAGNTPTSGTNSLQFDFPAALEHSQTQSPLTDQQRNDMLRLMATSSISPNNGSNNNNALVSPTPPPMPDISRLQGTKAELDMLMRMQRDADRKVAELANMVTPLSPTGSIPGLASTGGQDDGNQYFSSAVSNNGGNGPLDYDSLFNTDLFESSDPDFNFDTPSNNVQSQMQSQQQQTVGNGDFNLYDGNMFDESLPPAPTSGGDLGGRVVEQLDGASSASNSTTPVMGMLDDGGSPIKRRRGGGGR